MERTRSVTRNVDAILCSDMHLREDTPTCWTGDFQMEQWTAVQCLKNLQAKYKCPVLHAGDLFHHWKPSPWLLSMAMRHLPADFYSIYGQHDLPQHNLDLSPKCGMNTLEMSGHVKIVSACHYGQTPEQLMIPYTHHGKCIISVPFLMWHHLTYQKKPFPGAANGMAGGILRKYPKYDLILTGDNHQAFVEELDGRILVNPGSLTRQNADQIDFQPRVYLYYANTNTVEPVYMPLMENVITREHIEVKTQRNERIDSFISQLDGDWTIGLSFEENLETFKSKNNVDKEVMQLIYNAIENGTT